MLDQFIKCFCLCLSIFRCACPIPASDVLKFLLIFSNFSNLLLLFHIGGVTFYMCSVVFLCLIASLTVTSALFKVITFNYQLLLMFY